MIANEIKGYVNGFSFDTRYGFLLHAECVHVVGLCHNLLEIVFPFQNEGKNVIDLRKIRGKEIRIKVEILTDDE